MTNSMAEPIETALSSLDASHPREGRRGCVAVFFLVFCSILLAGLGFLLSSQSFVQIERMRQLERAPQIPTSAVIAGEVNLRGQVAPGKRLLKAPRTHRECVYYYYTIEEERRDSDGDTYWATIHSSSDRVDFRLIDSDGEILIRGSESGIHFEAPLSYRRIEGKLRYTERRIDPGEEIFVFGFANRAKNGEYQIGFQTPGAYFPTISTRTEEARRFSQAQGSAFLVVGGAAAMLFAVLLLLVLFRLHHSALFLAVSFFVLTSTLATQGFLMTLADLEGANEAAHRIVDEGQLAIQEVLDNHGIAWRGDVRTLGSISSDPEFMALPEEDRRRLLGVRALMAQYVERTNRIQRQFPENILGPLFLDLEPLAAIEIPAEDLSLTLGVTNEHTPIRFGLLYGLISLLIGGLGTLFGTRRGLKTIGLKRTIESVPTSKVKGTVFGLTELKGQVAPLSGDELLSSRLTNTPCLHYRYLEEHRQGSGKNERWVTVADESRSLPFRCCDSTGEIVVDPGGASLFVARKCYQSRISRRYTEWIIAPNEPVYILGPAQVNAETHDRLEVRSDEDAPYLISTFTEEELMLKKANVGFLFLTFGIVASMVTGIGLGGMVTSFGPMLYVTTVIFIAIYLASLLAFLYYNDLVFLRERTRRGWANIDVTLKKRFDLVTSLAAIVEGQFRHERELQEVLAAARSAQENAIPKEDRVPDREKINAAAEHRTKLFALRERYPALKSDKNVEVLFESLRNLEDEIALIRAGYNDAVERYNSKIHHFPEFFIARALGFRDRLFFQAPPEVMETPSVQSDHLAQATEAPASSSVQSKESAEA